MRIAHITSTFPPHWTGTGNVCYYNARELSKRGHEVHVFTATFEAAPSLEIIEGFIVHRLKPILHFGNAPLLPGLLKIKDFDLIHLHYPFIFGAELIWIVSKIRKIPYIITFHNDLIGVGIRKILFTGYSRLLTWLTLKGASKLCVVSNDHILNSRLLPLFMRRLEDVVEIPNGVDIELFNPNIDGNQVRKDLGIPLNARVILFVGALATSHHYRRVDILIRAMKELGSRNYHLVLAGEGDRLDEYQKLAENLEILSNVHFVGKVNHQYLPKIYSCADLFVLPSHIQEAFPLVILEAMACGKPFIASNLPGVRSMLDCENGLLVKAGDQKDLERNIRKLIVDKSLCVEMGNNGRNIVENKYDWALVTSRLSKVYEEVLTNL